ncbi:MAG: tRNA uridine-5-carboxymethylaminomethyl(34) synthesis GTPase MnmE [Saprospiraceae bacterium]|nr:tRNA uridine-5-carboxymethylaminomethyl(34) synthesis GTPase MnmE [Saprospiraceae bacterium]
MHATDTIAALITGQGTSAVGQIRISGPDSLSISNVIFKGQNLNKVSSHSLHFGKIIQPDGHVLDEVLVSVFRSPHSYTGEDVVEISCHGSLYILQEVLNLIYSKGIRPAEAGEFTRRAWLNGKMDLSQAEAVADLIASETRASHLLAINQLKGGIRNEIAELRATLLDFAALIELELDFSEEDVEFADRGKLSNLLDQISDKVTVLLDSFRLGNAVRNGVQTVIAGRPNAGKSTLLNALLGENRALVSDIPGTTRDTVEEKLNIDGVLFHFVDTAGLREARDQVEAMGIARSYEKIKEAAIVLYVYDVQNTNFNELESDILDLNVDPESIIMVANKSDLISEANKPETENVFLKSISPIHISAKNEEGISELKKSILMKVLGNQSIQEDSIAINARHRTALESALQEIIQTKKALLTGLTTDLVAQQLKSVLYHLGLVSGEITNDQILGHIFGKFCIGK